jgi:hypothetical protein
MKLSFPAGILIFAAVASAQPSQLFQPLARLKDYLQLSDAQLQTILGNNEQYNRWSAEKQARIRQVQIEIADETARDPLDPMALGVRYAEIAGICREMNDEAAAYQKKNTDVLTAPQKTKLQALQDALTLAPVISDAQSGNLLGSPGYAPPFFTSGGIGSVTGSLVGLIGPANGCSIALPVFRSGDFSGAAEINPTSASPLAGGVFRVGGGATTPTRRYQLQQANGDSLTKTPAK